MINGPSEHIFNAVEAQKIIYAKVSTKKQVATRRNQTQMNIGILGGTFDPVHNGHIRLAIEAYQHFELDQVVFLPTPEPTHREKPKASFADRCALVKKALAPLNFCSVFELKTDAKDQVAQSKTWYAMGQIRQRLGDTHQYFFILGEDSFNTLAEWHEVMALVRNSKFLVFARAQTQTQTPKALIELLGSAQAFSQLKKNAQGWCLAQSPRLDICASYVRACLASWHPANMNVQTRQNHCQGIYGLVPDQVLEHIKAHGLYQHQPATQVQGKPMMSASNTISLEQLTQHALAALEDLKGQDILEVDLVGKADFADTMIVVSGTSNRHVKALAQEVQESIKEKLKEKPLGVEGDAGAEWILVDYGTLIIHIMLPATRDFYELERLWTARPDDARNPNP